MSLQTLKTIVVEIEAVMNGRPLIFVSSEAGDREPLTPSHLFHGRRIICLPHQMIEFDGALDLSYVHAWRSSTNLHDPSSNTEGFSEEMES